MKLSESVYYKLRDDIFHAQYKPNVLITERQIAEKYGVSKLTAGEVLHRLSVEGHLTCYPRSGYMVTVLSPKEMAQLGRIRYAIECLVLESVCTEASGEQIRSLYALIVEDPAGVSNASAANAAFHMGMAELTDDRFLISILQDILGSLSRVEQQISAEEAGTWQEYHRKIVDALLARDVQAAREYLRMDLDQRAH